MKTAKGIAFGFAAVNAGQRNTTTEPQVIVTSTEGNFRITPQVSKVLGVQHGDNILFVSNVDAIDAAIRDKAEPIVEFCEEQGLDINSPEALIAIHREFDTWGITKGIPELDPKGNQRTTQERLTKNDKIKFVSANFDAFLENALQEADEETKDALQRDGITEEEQIDILIEFVKPRELPKFKGSKAANPGGSTGTGVPLTFTDSNVWKQLKADMGEDSTKFNRVFDIDLDNIQDAEINDGYKNVPVKVLVLEDYTDKEPARVGAKDEE